jgi:hypothetical protein
MTSEQAWDWMDSIAHRLIRRAARNAPFSLSERLQEEWLADLAAQVGPIARLRFALGCCSATSVIAHERAVALPAASASLGHAHPIRAGHDHIPFFTGRTLTFVVVATVHVAVLYSLATALGPTYSKVSLSPLLNRPLEAPPRSSLPPLPPPRLSLPRIELPPQETPPPVQSEPTNVIHRVSRSRRLRCRPRSIACKEAPALDFRVPTTSIQMPPFGTERKGLLPSRPASMARAALPPSR